VVRFAVPPVSNTGPSTFQDPVSAVAIIPARFDSTRLPGKPLAEIAGRPMIEHVYRRAAAARCIMRVIVATDDERVAAAVIGFGGEVAMTASTHQSGTDRLAEVARALDADVIVNVQGDEPLLEPAMIDDAVAPLASDRSIEMAPLCRRIDDRRDLDNPHVVKVVVDRDGFAMYFSRAPIPFARNPDSGADAWRHVGLYVYRRDCLLRLASLTPTSLERAEALEQLRALEHGIRIRVVETHYDTIGVDTPADLERVRQLAAPPARV
jgi:3-deoxy-manno-octulosonate cytidylyltransferase (CMP-KDO synthetase)